MNKALTVGECKSDIEICLMFGQRLNPEWWPWYKPADGKSLDLAALQQAVEDFFSDQLKELGFDWKTFQELGLYQPGAHGFEYEKYEKGMLRFDGAPGFNTITGQIEAYSILYESWGEDPLPYYEEPNYSPISKPDLAGQYPLITTSVLVATAPSILSIVRFRPCARSIRGRGARSIRRPLQSTM